MYHFIGKSSYAEDIEAVGKSQAMIWFKPSGEVLNANSNFCAALEYDLSEIVGKHHQIFVDPAYAKSEEYADFWDTLRSGKFVRAQFRRFAKSGREVWIEASYNPILRNGKVVRILKIASDITQMKQKSLDDHSKLQAISRSQAVIEFRLDGTVIDANANFLKLMKYELSEVKDKHHRMFCEREYAASQDYVDFWAKLRRGEFMSASFVRKDRNGRSVYIQAAYNPIVDSDGKIYKIVKFATDITARMQSMEMLSDAINELASGNLTAHVDEKLDDLLEPTRQALNKAIERLEGTVAKIAASSQTIAKGSVQLRDDADTIARRNEHQAASAEQSSAALAEMSGRVDESSLQAANAGQITAGARSEAEKSGRVVADAKEAMTRIEHSSQEISKIIGVIDEIAFQTNLLALNAGVEAARAGEAGKGFAVVAQEVRELAQRAANAAKEIKGLILNSNKEVAKGVELVGETGDALHRIVEHVAQIDRLVSSIAGTAKEQSVGIREITNAVSELDRGTQENAATVSGVHGLSEALAAEASDLSGLIASFKISQSAMQAYRLAS